MSLSVLKGFLAVVVLILTLFFGWLPLQKEDKNFFYLANYFSCGVFLSTAIFHLLADATGDFQGLVRYPLLCSFLIALVFALLMFLLEYLINHFCHKEQRIAAYLLTFLLFFHSFIEGITIGINKEILEVLTLFVAIFVHKGSESFAYSVAMQHYRFPKIVIKGYVLLFTLMTPLGILFASGALPLVNNHIYGVNRAIINAVAAGTFFYLFMENLDPNLFRLKTKKRAVFNFSVGFVLMWLLSFWT